MSNQFIDVAGRFKEALAYGYPKYMRVLKYLVSPMKTKRSRMFVNVIAMLYWLIYYLVDGMKVTKMYAIALAATFAVLYITHQFTLVWLMNKARKHVYYTMGVVLDKKACVSFMNMSNETKGWLK